MDFKLYNDYELIYLIREHNEKALNLFINKYTILLGKLLSDKRIHGELYNDLLADGIFLVYKCLRIHNNEGNFYTLLKACMIRHISRKYKKQRLQEVIVDFSNFSSNQLNYNIVNYELPLNNELQENIAEALMSCEKLSDLSKKLDVKPSKIYYELNKMKKNIKVDGYKK